MPEDCIPEEWIKHHVDTLLDMAKKLKPGKMSDACLVRAEYYMDLVKTYRERDKQLKDYNNG